MQLCCGHEEAFISDQRFECSFLRKVRVLQHKHGVLREKRKTFMAVKVRFLCAEVGITGRGITKKEPRERSGHETE